MHKTLKADATPKPARIGPASVRCFFIAANFCPSLPYKLMHP